MTIIYYLFLYGLPGLSWVFSQTCMMWQQSSMQLHSPGSLAGVGTSEKSLVVESLAPCALSSSSSLALTSFFFFICSEFCHTLEWNSHGFTCVPHPDPPSHLPLHPLSLGFSSAPGPSACLMHPTWAGDLFHPRYCTCFDDVLLKHPTLSFSHRV